MTKSTKVRTRKLWMTTLWQKSPQTFRNRDQLSCIFPASVEADVYKEYTYRLVMLRGSNFRSGFLSLFNLPGKTNALFSEKDWIKLTPCRRLSKLEEWHFWWALPCCLGFMPSETNCLFTFSIFFHRIRKQRQNIFCIAPLPETYSLTLFQHEREICGVSEWFAVNCAPVNSYYLAVISVADLHAGHNKHLFRRNLKLPA